MEKLNTVILNNLIFTDFSPCVIISCSTLKAGMPVLFSWVIFCSLLANIYEKHMVDAAYLSSKC